MSWGKRTKAGKVKREDKWFSLAIRQRDGNQCRNCGSTEGIQCAHIYGRRTKSTRWSTDNAVALCGRCHRYFTGEPIEWAHWCRIELGEAHMDALRDKHNQILKTSEVLRGLISDHYRTEYNRMCKSGDVNLQDWQF